tara:strand:+ start:364 stop:510 length:147 start_codon:yes stop_codon:yes gene_type:complete
MKNNIKNKYLNFNNSKGKLDKYAKLVIKNKKKILSTVELKIKQLILFA